MRAAMDRQMRDPLTVDEHLAAIAGDQPNHHIKAGGFTGAVSAG